MDDSRRLRQILQGLPNPKILVVGDLILDRYADGKTGRVSPEAPVLVFELDSERYLLGGACNVAANLHNLGAETSVLGVIGDDEAGRTLRQLLGDDGIDTGELVTDRTRPTTRKTRYVAKTAQVLRVDELQEGALRVGGGHHHRCLEARRIAQSNRTRRLHPDGQCSPQSRPHHHPRLT
jgi:rfaE bifunctional protein kinase chain/domain